MVKRLTYRLIVLLCLIGTSSVQAQLNTDRITAIGRNALYFEDYVLSIQYFNQVIKLKPYLAEPYFLRAIAKLQLSDYTGALDDCNKAIERNPFHPGSYYTRGYIYRQMNEWQKAEADFTEALVFSPDNKAYLMLRADVRAQMQHFDEALQDIDYLLHREPNAPSLLFEKGVICIQKKDTLCAYDYLSKTVKYDSQNSSAWSALGLVDMYMSNDSAAAQHLTRAIDLGSKWAGDYMNRGILNYHQHNYRAALSDYDEAVRLAPQEASCYYNRSLLRTEIGDYNRALDDLDKAIDLAPEQTEMRYQRSLVLMELGQWQTALNDIDTLLNAFPYFLPSYYMAAQAKTALGDKKSAYQYRQKAYLLEQKKDSIQALHNATAPSTDVKIAQSSPKKRDVRKEFSTRTAQNGTETTEDETGYSSATRGSIQKRYTDVINEPNIILSYYTSNTALRNTNYQHPLLYQLNRRHILPSTLYATYQELTLTADMVNDHFENINRLSRQLDEKPSAELHFARAIEFALVQDYTSAIDDCTQALTMVNHQQDKTMVVLLTFCRANWRYKNIEYMRANGDINNEYHSKSVANRFEMDYDIMLRDYDYVIRLQQDFAFAYYNKANILCLQQDYNTAIDYYTKALKEDNDFAEAYFNRGLTYIYTDRIQEGIADLSKAGELGIYQAYNLITRFR